MRLLLLVGDYRSSSSRRSHYNIFLTALFLHVVVVLLVQNYSPIAVVAAYTNNNHHSPYLDRRAIAGLWKLSRIRPLKEFTVYPKKDPKPLSELLLMLNEDGSFKRYYNNQHQDDDDDDDISESWDNFMNYKKNLDPSWKNVNQGTWDYIDGELILAVDRVKKSKYQEQKNTKSIKDTLLKGEVVVMTTSSSSSTTASTVASQSQTTSSSSSADTTTISSKTTTTTSSTTEKADKEVIASSNNDDTAMDDMKLSVPIGSVQVGKFMYPKKHPSFFDTPMFQPKPKGSFQLRQILTTYKPKPKEIFIEKFKNKDFYNKRFLLTTQPLKQRKRKNNNPNVAKDNSPWNLKNYKKKKEEEEEEKNRLIHGMRVMEVMFFANNTFATTGGLGGSTILRGRYDVIGKDRDQIWLQVRRFGFGRSVSGSIYSEGVGLSHEDAKSYWGTISYENENENNENDENSSEEKTNTIMMSSSSNKNNNFPKDKKKKTTSTLSEEEDNNKNDKNDIQQQQQQHRRLQANGSVIIGWGLEPAPVARFIMREATSETILYDDDDDEDEDEDDDDDDDTITEFNIENIMTNDDDDDDDTMDWSNAFQ